MIIEDMLIAHWLRSKDPSFLSKNGIDETYFTVRSDVVAFISTFITRNGVTPTIDLVKSEFDWLSLPDDLDPVPYLIGRIKELKVFAEFRPILIEAASQMEEGSPIEAMHRLRNEIDNLLRRTSKTPIRHDWVKDAMQRYDAYMERSEKSGGLAGISTGIKKLDEIVGGWKSDDLVLIAGRTNEGKSYVGLYFAYMAWVQLKRKNISSPIIYITTEMPEIEVAWRLDTLRAHFSNRALNEGRLSNPNAYKEYLEQLKSESPSFLVMSNEANDGRSFTPVDIRRIIDSDNPALIVIDQLYDLSDGTRERDIRRRIVNVVNAIREIGLYTNTPIILIAQAGRDAVKEAKKDTHVAPELHQIQESDTPAQKATKVITIRKINDIIKLTVRKNRGGERDKDVVMRVDLDTGIWEEILDVEAVF